MTDTSAKSGPKAGRDELVFLALGGLGEIGMNVYMYGFGPAGARNRVTAPRDIGAGIGDFTPCAWAGVNADCR